MRKSLVVICLLIAACGSTQQLQPARPFKNLKALPLDTSKSVLYTTMRTWSRSLGVECDHCHVQHEKADFVSDEKREKSVARAMFAMTSRMNADYISRYAEHGAAVTCNTCHRGKVVPES
jgi:Photosynthetic reaction centre cytochrome C subunit